jgi:2-polyprenyl-6-methoxyphenol hydroxylase-like FAD-dependent oxidoreductase
MSVELDALVIGAGPAGASTAILLAEAGWRVALIEREDYPRQKVCGECLTAGSLALLDALDVGQAVRGKAGPDLKRVAWMDRARTVVADLPACTDGPYRYGRALGRDQLDALLIDRARGAGVRVLQPAKVISVRRVPGSFECAIEQGQKATPHARGRLEVRAFTVVDAHGSWETAPVCVPAPVARPAASKPSDLFGFKASFFGSALEPGLLPVLSFEGGYGGMVLAEDGRLTIACCIRRDSLRKCRARAREASAGTAVEEYLRFSCRGVRDALEHARRQGPWLSVGALRPGSRVHGSGSMGAWSFKVGNAAGEAHPLIGEGINMALQSAFLLSDQLSQQPASGIDERRARIIHRAYARSWHRALAPRLRLAAVYAHIAMRPALRAHALLQRWPSLLTQAADWAGKARGPMISPASNRGAS